MGARTSRWWTLASSLVTVPERTTVLIVDDDQWVRRSLAEIFEATSDLVVVGEATDGDEVVEAVRRLRPHVVLMDLMMNRVGGLAATEAVMLLRSPPAVVTMTALDTDGMVIRSLEAGAVSFLSKDESPAVFHRYVRTVAAGRIIFSRDACAQLAAAGRSRTASPGPSLASLSPRELEVLVGVARGRNNGEIAAELFLGETTVKTHVSSIYTKLAVPNRVLAAVAALRAGLVPL